jgi:uncharacterized protein YggE
MDTKTQDYLKKSLGALTLFLGVLTLFVIVKGVQSLNPQNAEANNTISVEGSADVYAVPDIATISFGAQATDKDVNGAQAKVEAVVSKAVAALAPLGVDKKDVQTTYYSANPQYEWGKCVEGVAGCINNQRLVGYQVNETITVKVRDLAKVSDILGAIGATGVSDIQGPNFDVEDREALVQQAREEAIEKAKEKAKVLAKDLGVSLGRIVSFNDNSSYPIPYYSKGMAMDLQAENRAVAPTIEQGQNKITASISIVYKIR